MMGARACRLSVLARGTATAALLSLLAAGSSCAVDDKTQITVALSSETEIPKELDSFSVRVISMRTGELRFFQDYFPKSGREFPTTLAVIPLDESSLGSPLRIELEGRQNGTVFLKRQSVVSYIEGRNILLTMPLRMACFQFGGCGPNETCSGGQCVPAAVPKEQLIDFDPKFVFPTADRCFDEQACLDTSVEVQVREDCTFDLPEGIDSSLGNISIRWAAAPQRILALDEGDAQEGWVRTAPNAGRLSQGACDSHFQRRGPDGAILVPDWAKTVYFTAKCAAKTWKLPYCFSDVTKHAGIGAVVP
jgi:hypothetical protein